MSLYNYTIMSFQQKKEKKKNNLITYFKRKIKYKFIFFKKKRKINIIYNILKELFEYIY